MRFGFAVGCQAVALPRRTSPLALWATPLVRPVAKQSEGLSPNQGHSPRLTRIATAGRSHRLTSGGKAGTMPALTSCTKPTHWLVDSLVRWLVGSLGTRYTAVYLLTTTQFRNPQQNPMKEFLLDFVDTRYPKLRIPGPHAKILVSLTITMFKSVR